MTLGHLDLEETTYTQTYPSTRCHVKSLRPIKPKRNLIRRKPTTQTLVTVSNMAWKNGKAVIYKEPVMKMPIRPSFCLLGIFTFQSIGIGKANMKRSVVTFSANVAMK